MGLGPGRPRAGYGRQAGGRKGAVCGPEWNAFTMNANLGSAVGQMPRDTLAGEVAT